MTMTATDFAAPFLDVARDITWYPAANTGDPRTIKAVVRQMKPEEFQGGANERRFLAVVHVDQITAQSPDEPEQYDLLEWDDVRRTVDTLRKATIRDELVWWKLEAAS